MENKRCPIFQLKYSFKRGVLRLDPYPMKKSSPRLILKRMWPFVGSVSLLPATQFLHTSCGPAGNLDYTEADIIQVMEEVERHWIPRDKMEHALNAYLLHNPVTDDRLAVSKEEKAKLDIFENYLIIPVSVFHIEVEVGK